MMMMMTHTHPTLFDASFFCKKCEENFPLCQEDEVKAGVEDENESPLEGVFVRAKKWLRSL